MKISAFLSWSEIRLHKNAFLNQGAEEDSKLTQGQLLGANLPLPLSAVLRKDPLYQAPWVPPSCGFSFH